ncbi:synaptotagmin-17-like [Dendronephthya gigantea]|uniref:synaptotagmin-17-like n=1 Tax=Dendronephthya gigantea TaxID=151771 RepID=UPI00106CCD46|nr:synaptotagmin-17-like [Dendronephthya gigantea]
MKWAIYILSATISCFIVLLLAVLFILSKYYKRLKETRYTPVDKQSINFETCVDGKKKPYAERLVQYLLGYSDTDGTNTDTDGLDNKGGGLDVQGGLPTKIVPVQPSSESDGDYHMGIPQKDMRPRTHTYQNPNKISQIDMRSRSYTIDSPSPEGRGGIWRARESLFYKHGKNRRGSKDDSDNEGRRCSPVFPEFSERPQFPRRSPIVDHRSKMLSVEAVKVTGKPPLSPKTVKSLPSTPLRQTQQFNFNMRRNSAAMVLDKPVSQLLLAVKSGPSSVGSAENLAFDLGNLEVTLNYSSEERLLKVSVVNITSPEERSLVDTYIKVTFYLFEKPYKNEMQMWSDATKSLVRRTFSYLVKDIGDLQRAVLRFTLKRKNSLIRNKILGKSVLKLSGVQLVEPQAYTLKLCHSVTELVGEILVSVCHQATTGILQVGVVRGMDLPRTVKRTTGAPFVIIELSNQEEIVFVKNTKQKSNKINPLFEEKFDIPVTTDSETPLSEFHLQFTVLRYTFTGKNDVVGLVRLESGSSYENEANHWKEVTMNPHTTVMKWHKLRFA